MHSRIALIWLHHSNALHKFNKMQHVIYFHSKRKNICEKGKKTERKRKKVHFFPFSTTLKRKKRCTITVYAAIAEEAVAQEAVAEATAEAAAEATAIATAEAATKAGQLQ